MSVYMIPFQVNARKFVILHLADRLNEQKRYEFVCAVSNMGTVPLLRFLKKLRASSTLNTEKDCYVSLDKIEAKEPVNNVQGKNKGELYPYFIHLKKEENTSTEKLDLQDENLILQQSDGKNQEPSISINNRYTNCYMCIEFELILTIDDKEYKGDLIFHMVPMTDYYNLVIDFGSEAAQALIRPNTPGFDPEPLDIIKIAKQYVYTNYKENIDNQFHQYPDNNERNMNLFRSMFYIVEGRPKFLSLVSEDDALKRSGHLLPNLKVSLLENGQNEVLMQYRAIILDFIKCAAKRINELRRNTVNDELTKGLHINLLIPNVMQMSLVNKLIKELDAAFKGAKDYDVQLNEYCLEITTSSESDASFLGYLDEHMEINQLSANRTYLLIDAGKGTMDFSVICVDNLRNFRSIYRDGFVGSGNALTYALFDHLCTVIIGSVNVEKRKKLMQQLLFGSQVDQVGLRKLLNVLEKIKIKSSEGDNDNVKLRCQNLHDRFNEQWNGLHLEALNEYLEDNIGNYGDMYGIIHGTCSIICTLLVKSLLQNNITTANMPEAAKDWMVNKNNTSGCFDELILAGRAFRHPILYKTLLQFMRRYFNIEPDKVRYDSDRAKTSCLYGALNINKFINCNCGLSGIPAISTALAGAGNGQHNNSKQKNDFFLNLLYSDDNQLPVNAKPLQNFNINEEFLNKGYDTKIDKNCFLHLNGRALYFQNGMEGENFNLYFSGNELILRNSQNVTPLLRAPNRFRIDSLLQFESRFPIFNDSDRDQIRLFRFPRID